MTKSLHTLINRNRHTVGAEYEDAEEKLFFNRTLNRKFLLMLIFFFFFKCFWIHILRFWCMHWTFFGIIFHWKSIPRHSWDHNWRPRQGVICDIMQQKHSYAVFLIKHFKCKCDGDKVLLKDGWRISLFTTLVPRMTAHIVCVLWYFSHLSQWKRTH